MNSATLSRRVGHPVEAKWSHENENWCIYDKNTKKLLMEFETGAQININRIREHLYKLRNRDIITKDGLSLSKEVWEHKDQVKRQQGKMREERRQMALEAAEEMLTYRKRWVV